VKNKDQLKKELESFNGLWEGGTTLVKQGWNRVSKERNIDAIYNVCVRPYINKDTTVLEIGCNGGGWTKKMLHAKKVIGFDALSRRYTGFDVNIGRANNVEYYQVKDFKCNELGDNSIDYVFSYDVFCHISYSGTEEYLKNLYPKVKKGANFFIMIADADKYTNKRSLQASANKAGFSTIKEYIDDYDGEAKGGRWFFYGTEKFCELLNKYMYNIVSRDVMGDLDPLSPTIHFIK